MSNTFRACSVVLVLQLLTLLGEAADYGRALVRQLPSLLAQLPSEAKRAAFLGTGEFTVTLPPGATGTGGRNAEMLLAFALEAPLQAEIERTPLQADSLEAPLQSEPIKPRPSAWVPGWRVTIAAGAFDGIEGNSPAMGGILDSWLVDSAWLEGGLTALGNHDAYSFLSARGASIISGPTGTNVNDMLLILMERLP